MSIDVEVDSSELQIDGPAQVGLNAGRRLPIGGEDLRTDMEVVSSKLQNDCPAEGVLYTGRRLPRAEKYALHGVINGFIPNDREPRGRACIQCSGPSMWACAAPALGFTVRGANVNCDGFMTLLECMDQAPEKTLPQGAVHFNGRRMSQKLEAHLGEVQVVFTDYEALPDYSRSLVSYWSNPHWRVPHVLFVEPKLMPLQPPPEWSSIELMLPHSHLGGSTTAKWGLVALLPPSFPSCVPYNLPPQPWMPMHSRLNRMVGGDITAPPSAARQIDHPQVQFDDVTGGLTTDGLFPHDNLAVKVVAPDDKSDTGFVLRSLTWQEKAALWDVPIRMVDEAGKRDDLVPIVETLFVTPPAKFLELGADALLSAVFRGGYREVKKSKKRSRVMERDESFIVENKKIRKKKKRERIMEESENKKIRKKKKRSRAIEASETMPQKRKRLVDGGSFVENSFEEKHPTTSPPATLDKHHPTTSPPATLDKHPTTSPPATVDRHVKLPSRWLQSPQELKEFDELEQHGGDPPRLPQPVIDDTHLFLSHTAKQDEQKADSAAVPEHLWSNSLKETFESKVGRSLPEGWQESMNGFRRFGIRWWRRQLLRTYLKWRRSHHPLPFGLDNREIYAPTSQGRTHLITKTWKEGVGYVYCWSKKGKSAYSKDHASVRNTVEGRATVKVALDAISRAAGPYTRDHDLYLSTWWEWVSGSAPFFWNWPERYQSEIRDGQKHFMLGKFHYFNKRQRGPKDEKDGPLIRKKVTGVRKKGYIEMGEVLSLIHYFYVPKGQNDIRMVYNGTSCGLNDTLWAPHFGLPCVRQTVRSLMPGYLQCDIDIGEMFLNFMLHDDLRALSGVDLKFARSDDVNDEEWERTRPEVYERWCRNWMGLRDSPYRSIQQLIRLKMDAYGDRCDKTNPFHWERVVLNFPGSEDYRPDLPWVMKVRFDGHLACEVFVYVDDGRITGFCREICWAAARKLASLCTKRGVQDAGRKRTGPINSPGPWAGTMCFTTDGRVTGLVSELKWEKTRKLVLELKEMVDVSLATEGGKTISRQRLLEIRGYLNYIVRTYGWMNPYLKGLHNTIDGWRENRDEGGWKMTPKQLQEKLSRQLEDAMLGRRESDDRLEKELDLKPATTEEPDLVAPVDRLKQDVKALTELTATIEPPKVDYRGGANLTAWYCPGDASGSGFGTALVMKERGILYESGMWTKEYAEESSNFREAENLVIRLEKEVREGDMQGREVFLFTDNLVFESTYYKGYSQSRKLSDIALRLHKLQREGNLILHVVHIAGTRMKEWGVDGLSRGDLLDGMMAGKDPLSFIPLNKGADERSNGAVKRWISQWWNVWPTPLTEMTPQLWFELRDVKGPRLWMPAPAAMEVVMEVFNEDRIAHPRNPHVFVIPRLMTHLWRKNLGKDADLMFTVESNVNFWGSSQHEPLIFAIVLPFSYTPDYSGPWLARSTPETLEWAAELNAGFKSKRRPHLDSVLKLDRTVREMWEHPEERGRVVLREFLNWARKFPPVSSCLLR